MVAFESAPFLVFVEDTGDHAQAARIAADQLSKAGLMPERGARVLVTSDPGEPWESDREFAIFPGFFVDEIVGECEEGEAA